MSGIHSANGHRLVSFDDVNSQGPRAHAGPPVAHPGVPAATQSMAQMHQQWGSQQLQMPPAYHIGYPTAPSMPFNPTQNQQHLQQQPPQWPPPPSTEHHLAPAPFSVMQLLANHEAYFGTGAAPSIQSLQQPPQLPGMIPQVPKAQESAHQPPAQAGNPTSRYQGSPHRQSGPSMQQGHHAAGANGYAPQHPLPQQHSQAGHPIVPNQTLGTPVHFMQPSYPAAPPSSSLPAPSYQQPAQKAAENSQMHQTTHSGPSIQPEVQNPGSPSSSEVSPHQNGGIPGHLIGLAPWERQDSGYYSPPTPQQNSKQKAPPLRRQASLNNAQQNAGPQGVFRETSTGSPLHRQAAASGEQHNVGPSSFPGSVCYAGPPTHSAHKDQAGPQAPAPATESNQVTPTPSSPASPWRLEHFEPQWLAAQYNLPQTVEGLFKHVKDLESQMTLIHSGRLLEGLQKDTPEYLVEETKGLAFLHESIDWFQATLDSFWLRRGVGAE